MPCPVLINLGIIGPQSVHDAPVPEDCHERPRRCAPEEVNSHPQIWIEIMNLTHESEHISLMHDLVNEKHPPEAKAVRDAHGLQRLTTANRMYYR
jgi:hypothetical protein